MDQRLENMYFTWLAAKVIRVKNPTPSLTYDTLLKTLHNTEFVWYLSGDDNRAEDGRELRRDFLIAAALPDDLEWRNEYPCSVFEMLIAFSVKAEFNTQIPAVDWFWKMLENLNLRHLNDASGISPYDIQEVLEHFMFRQYPPNGDGGLFPLAWPEEDQRQVEIWYQFCAYLMEQERYVS